MAKVAIIDYGMSNLRSVYQALVRVAPENVSVDIVTDAAQIHNADKVVFPGQGAAADCMKALKDQKFESAVREAIASKPFLGICMGMQMLVSYSKENGGTDCLDIFPGSVHSLIEKQQPAPHHKIPHIGWNQVQQSKDHPLWHGIDNNARFYFVHSYYVAPEDDSIVAGITHYGDNFACAIAADSVFAVQFHPEKSADDGLRLLKNFMSWNIH